VIEELLPRCGPCWCHRTLDARHRVIDAIRSRYAGGESMAFLARDYELPRSLVSALVSLSSAELRPIRSAGGLSVD
jgi:hypothetical protein